MQENRGLGSESLRTAAGFAAQQLRLPSPLEGEGGAEPRMRGLVPRPLRPTISGLSERWVSHPSSAPPGHLLPEGEKGKRVVF